MRAGAPSRHGVSPSGISAFLDAIERDSRIEPHGLIIQRHGHRVAEGHWRPHTSERSRLVYSLSKSFTGTALGLQLAAIWGRKPMLLVGGESAGRVLAAARRNGLEEFLFLHRPPTGRALGRIPGARCSLAGQHRGRYAPVVFDLDLQSCTTLPRARR